MLMHNYLHMVCILSTILFLYKPSCLVILKQALSAPLQSLGFTSNRFQIKGLQGLQVTLEGLVSATSDNRFFSMDSCPFQSVSTASTEISLKPGAHIGRICQLPVSWVRLKFAIEILNVQSVNLSSNGKEKSA